MEPSPTRFEALQAAVHRAGTQELFAEALGVSQPTVSRWVKVTKQLPAEYVLKAERLFGVSRFDLRPDIYPREDMIDQMVGDRFCGIDRQIVARQKSTQRGATPAELRKVG